MLDSLLPTVAPKSGRPSLNGFTPEEIQSQMDRMLASKLFKGSRRLSRFLRFTVEQTLAGERDRLKEYCIGLEVFEKPESFDPRMDSIVRVMARRLRILVNTYYQTDGRDDSLEIHFDSGSYVPTFRARTPGADHDRLSNEPQLLLVRADAGVIRDLTTILIGSGMSRAGESVDPAVAHVSGSLGGGLTAYDASTAGAEGGLLAFYVQADHRDKIVGALVNFGVEVMAAKPVAPEQLQNALEKALAARKFDSAVI
jgi:hypothetical protein